MPKALVRFPLPLENKKPGTPLRRPPASFAISLTLPERQELYANYMYPPDPVFKAEIDKGRYNKEYGKSMGKKGFVSPLPSSQSGKILCGLGQAAETGG